VKVGRQIFESKLEARRRMGRPRLRWLKDVEKVLWETNVKRRREKAVERGE